MIVLGLEQRGSLAVHAQEASDLHDRDGDGKRAEQIRAKGRDGHRHDWPSAGPAREHVLVGAANESTPARRDTSRNWARMA